MIFYSDQKGKEIQKQLGSEDHISLTKEDREGREPIMRAQLTARPVTWPLRNPRDQNRLEHREGQVFRGQAVASLKNSRTAGTSRAPKISSNRKGKKQAVNQHKKVSPQAESSSHQLSFSLITHSLVQRFS